MINKTQINGTTILDKSLPYHIWSAIMHKNCVVLPEHHYAHDNTSHALNLISKMCSCLHSKSNKKVYTKPD